MRSQAGRVVTVNDSTRVGNEEPMQHLNYRIPPPTHTRKTTTSISDLRPDPTPSRVSSFICTNVATTIQVPHLAITDQTLTPDGEQLTNENDKVAIIFKLQVTQPRRTIQKTTDMPNNIKIINTQMNSIRGLQGQNHLPKLSSQNSLQRTRQRTEAHTRRSQTIRSETKIIKLPPATVPPGVDMQASINTSTSKGRARNLITNKTTISPNIRMSKHPVSSGIPVNTLVEHPNSAEYQKKKHPKHSSILTTASSALAAQGDPSPVPESRGNQPCQSKHLVIDSHPFS